MKTNHLAILMATYNGENYIAQQMDSLLSQENALEWELFIHDDGSSDDSMRVINAYARQYPDRIHVVDGAATGCARDNFFYLLEQVEAPFYMFCDQDDIWHPEKIAKTWKKMQEITGSSEPHLVFTDLTVADQSMQTIAERMSEYQSLDPMKTAYPQLLIQNVITGCTCMIDRALRDLMIRPADRKNIVMHEWWSALIAAKFGTIGYVDEPLICYRQHGDNSLGAKCVFSMRYLREKLFDSSIRESMLLKERQAQAFYDAFFAGQETSAYDSDIALTEAFARLHDHGKLYRLRFYSHHHMWKSGLLRNIGLILLG